MCPVQFEGGLAEWAFTAGHGLKVGFRHSRDGDEIEIDGIGMVTVTGIPGSSIEEVVTDASAEARGRGGTSPLPAGEEGRGGESSAG